jgi:predicted Zn-dependent protease
MLRGLNNRARTLIVKSYMELQDQYDEAMHLYSQGEYDRAIDRLNSLLREDPTHFDAQLSVGMAYYRKGDYVRAIEEGHKAEKMRPHEQLVHTNLSLFYMKAGDKGTAEHHGLQARIASWKTPAGAESTQVENTELQMAKPPPPKPVKLPEMPWKKNKPLGATAPKEKNE